MALFRSSGKDIDDFLSLLILMCIARNKPLAVIGGGDSAAEEATCIFFSLLLSCLHPFLIQSFLSDLTKYGSHVYVLVRRGELRASKIMAKRLQNNPKIVRCPSLML